jgi:hypothetical protein
MKKIITLTALLGCMVAAHATGFDASTSLSKTQDKKSNITSWYTHFFWYVRNDTNMPVINLYMEHQAGSAINDHSVPVLAPGQQVGPFYGDWYSDRADYWTLKFANAYHNDWVLDEVKCSVEPSDVNQNNPVVIRIQVQPKEDTISGRTTEHILWNDRGAVNVGMPVSSSCNFKFIEQIHL